MKIPFGVCLAITLASAAAHADSIDIAPGRSENGYKYVFKDDPLAASVNDPSGAQIHVRPGAARQTLIRPRTNFVPELLKTAEAL